MPTGANLPNVKQVLDIAEGFGLELTAEEAESYCTLLQGAVKSYRRLEEMVEFRPPVKYPRDVGYRPAAEDNPHNGWYWRHRAAVIRGLQGGINRGMDRGSVPNSGRDDGFAGHFLGN